MTEFYFNHPFADGKRRIEAPEGSRYVVVRQRSSAELEVLECFSDFDRARQLVVSELERGANNVDELGYGETLKVTHMNLHPIPVID